MQEDDLDRMYRDTKSELETQADEFLREHDHTGGRRRELDYPYLTDRQGYRKACRDLRIETDVKDLVNDGRVILCPRGEE